MWETYVEPNLRAQDRAERSAAGGPAAPTDPDRPVTIEQKVAECQAAGLVFGKDPLEVARIARKSWPIKPAHVKHIRERLAARKARRTKK